MGKFLAGLILVTAIVAGAVLYYVQIYAFYDEVSGNGTDDVLMTSMVSGQPEPVLYDDFRAIDSDSSPIRYRACFTTTMSQAMLTETYEPYERAEPLVAPGWFDCFDADALGAALEDGRALAFLGQKDIEYGIDRIVAITEDGRGYVWHQINHCGEVVFDGQPAPEDCPEPPNGN
ncbi:MULTISPECIES: DUF6446 family protein [Roseovarius]|uniref:DUF6446 family protein n=1 Tax=Roseovarius TaxID=74030 RepID=UPI001C0B494B|nr:MULTISPECIES: DUF6446 family protein [Roseovarius]MBU3259378.1 histidine kinase [Roseovarius sp. PS-C2]